MLSLTDDRNAGLNRKKYCCCPRSQPPVKTGDQQVDCWGIIDAKKVSLSGLSGMMIE